MGTFKKAMGINSLAPTDESKDMQKVWRTMKENRRSYYINN